MVMSAESMEKFVQQVSSDKGVAEQLNAALAGKEGDDAVEGIVAFANEAGFEVDAEDVVRLGAAREGELSDDQLDAVAGGWTLIDYVNWRPVVTP